VSGPASGWITRSGSLVSWCMSMMWAMARRPWSAASARRRLRRRSSESMNQTATPRKTKSFTADSTAWSTSSRLASAGRGSRVIAAPITAASSTPIRIPIPNRSHRWGRASHRVSTAPRSATWINSTATEASPDPGNRSSIRLASRRAVPTIRSGTSRRYPPERLRRHARSGRGFSPRPGYGTTMIRPYMPARVEPCTLQW